MIRREFGQSGLRLSALCFGSMRFDRNRLSEVEAERLLGLLLDAGVTTFHSSHEYDTHEYFCRILRKLRPATIEHIAKVGVPHFGDTGFSVERLHAIVDSQLRDLGTERLDVLQWLVRTQPLEDAPRIRLIEDHHAEISDAFTRLQEAGKIGVVASFPYSAAFAEAVLDRSYCQGLVTYLNALEQEMLPFLEREHLGYVAIRPLKAGALTRAALTAPDAAQTPMFAAVAQLGLAPEEISAFFIQYPLLHPRVTSVMLSVTSEEHARAAISAVASSSADLNRFKALSEHFREASDAVGS